jgi:hypothetical protein
MERIVRERIMKRRVNRSENDNGKKEECRRKRGGRPQMKWRRRTGL